MLAQIVASILFMSVYGLVKSLMEGVTFQNPYAYVELDQAKYLWQKEYLHSWKSFLSKAFFHDVLGLHFLSANKFQNQAQFRNTPFFVTVLQIILAIMLVGVLWFIMFSKTHLRSIFGHFHFVPSIIILVYIIKVVLTLVYQGSEAWTLIWKTIKREVDDAFVNNRQVRILEAFHNMEWRKSFIEEMVSEEVRRVSDVFKYPIFGLIKIMATWKESITMLAFYFIYALTATLSINASMRTVSDIMMDDDEVKEATETGLKRIVFLSGKLFRIVAYAFPITVACILVTWIMYNAIYEARFRAVEYLIRNLYVLSVPVQVFTQFLLRILYGFYANTIDTVDLELFRPHWKSSFEKLCKTSLPLVLITFICAYLMMLSIMVWIESDPFAYYHYIGHGLVSWTNQQLKSNIETYAQVIKVMVLMSSLLFGAFFMLRNFDLDKMFYVGTIYVMLFLTLVFLILLFLFI